MNAIEELEKYIEDEGITQISGGIFKEQTRRRVVHHMEDTNEYVYESYQVQPNTTVAKYCEEMGLLTSKTTMGYHLNDNPTSAEEYAKELLVFLTAPTYGVFEQFLDDNEDNIEVDYSRGFKFNDSKKKTPPENPKKPDGELGVPPRPPKRTYR